MQFFFLLKIKSTRFLFSCAIFGTIFFICFRISPADLFHPPPQLHLQRLQSPDISFLVYVYVCPGFSCIETQQLLKFSRQWLHTAHRLSAEMLPRMTSISIELLMYH